MAGKVKTWVWVVVGIVVLGILGVIAMAAAGLWFVKSHVNIRTTTVAAATEDFQTVRQRFAAQKPLIELDEHGDVPARQHRSSRRHVAAADAEHHGVRCRRREGRPDGRCRSGCCG